MNVILGLAKYIFCYYEHFYVHTHKTLRKKLKRKLCVSLYFPREVATRGMPLRQVMS